jgi:hypothetical protein
MSRTARSTRARITALSSGLVLSLSLVATPAALAQDSPTDTIDNLMIAVEALDFEALPTFFCEEFADDMGGLDLGSMAEGLPEGVDPQTLLDAFMLDVELTKNEVISQTETEAIVHIVGTMNMGIDVEALTPFITTMLEASGQEVTEDMVEMMTAMMATQIAEEEMSEEIDEEITLVPGESMAWVVCDELGGDDDMSDDSMDDDMSDDMSGADDMSDDSMDDDMSEDEDGE